MNKQDIPRDALQMEDPIKLDVETLNMLVEIAKGPTLRLEDDFDVAV